MILQAPASKTIVIGGGFNDEEQAESFTPDVNTEELEGSHEEAYTLMVLLCVRSRASSIVVAPLDTDVLVLLGQSANMSCPRVCMKAATSKTSKYIPVHSVAGQFDNNILSSLPAFRWLTGSDTTFSLAGHTKKLCLLQRQLK